MKGHRLRHRSVLAVLLLSLALTQSAAAQVVLIVQQIVGFQLLKGQPQWAPQIQQRLAQTVLSLLPDGTVVIEAPGRTDLYPLRGTYQVQDERIVFFAERRSQSGQTGTAHLVWNGIISKSDGHARVEITSGSANSAYVDGQGFSGSVSSQYVADLILGGR